MRSMDFIQHIENRGRILKLQFLLTTTTKKPQTFCLQKAKSVEEVGERKGGHYSSLLCSKVMGESGGRDEDRFEVVCRQNQWDLL